MYKPEKIIVVGGNAAGPSAAAKAKRTNPDAEVIMFEAGEYISTGTCEMPYVISGLLDSYKDLVFFDDASFENSKGVKVYLRHRVESIDRNKREIIARDLESDKTYPFDYDSLVLCTGSKANTIPDIPKGMKNVFTLKSVSDLKFILDYLDSYKVKNCLVIGAGYIGLETADALAERGINIYLSERSPKPFPGSEPEVQDIISGLLDQNKIEFISSEGLKYFYDNNLLHRFKHDGRLIDIDLVIVTAGVAPNNELAISAKIDTGVSGTIKVDRKLRTSDPRIFAAGDNIQVINAVSGKPDYIPQATLAHSYGHIAGANAAGDNEFSNPVVKNIAVELFGKSFSQVGLTLEEAKKYFYNAKAVAAEAPNLVKVMPESDKVFGKIIYSDSDNKILGASFAGGKEVVGYADIISTMITGNINAMRLAEISFNYTPPLSPFINLLSILGRKINRS